MKTNPFIDDDHLILTGKATYLTNGVTLRKGDSISRDDYEALPESHKEYFSEPVQAMKDLGYHIPTVDLQDQVRGIVMTPFGDTAEGGMFRVDANIECTKESGEGDPTVDIVIGYTNQNGEQEMNVIAGFSLAELGDSQGGITVHSLGRLSFRATIDGEAGSPKYNLRLRIS